MRAIAIEAAGAFAAMLLLSVGLTWPLLPHFHTAIAGIDDARHFLWLLWHTREALLGREPFFQTSLLYYPHGASLVPLALGPASGVLAFPFFSLGFEPAYNAALLLGFALSGCAAYGLARGLGFDRPTSLFSAVVFTSAPIHLSALCGHLQKAFIAALPLIVLGTVRCLDVERSRWWALLAAGAMLLALLQSGEQFVFGGLAIAFLSAAALLKSARGGRVRVLWRLVLLGAGVVVASLPLLIGIARVLRDPQIEVARAADAPEFRPDLLQFFAPNWSSRLFGSPTKGLLTRVMGESPRWADVSIPLAVTLLCVLALARGAREAWLWVAFTGLFIVLAMGPYLGVAGRASFTPFEITITLPFAAMAWVPGLSAIRATDRFMLMGFVGASIAAAFGLDWVRQRLAPRLRSMAPIVAIVAVLLEVWPATWAQESLPHVSEFHRKLAADAESYGVFDLPIRTGRDPSYFTSYVTQSGTYQLLQMTHRKGIASGYLSREFIRHPVFADLISNGGDASPWQSDLLVDGRPSPRFANAEFELASQGYRYVIFHKPRRGDRPPMDAWAVGAANSFLAATFARRAPVAEDDFVRVYEVSSPPDAGRLVPALSLRESWADVALQVATGQRWAVTPASLLVASPRAQAARLEVTPAQIYDPSAGAIREAVVTLRASGIVTAIAKIRGGRTTSIPLEVSRGMETVELTIENPDGAPGAKRDAPVRFAIKTINLVEGK